MMNRNDVNVKNVPAYAYNAENPFWVARWADNAWWFYGAYETAQRACDVAVEVDGEIIRG